MTTQKKLFGDAGPGTSRSRARDLQSDIATPLWTAYKSRLLDEYIHHFLMVTKHGVYLDLFAGPQRGNDTENWSVRRILRRRTQGPAISHYAVCDNDPEQIERLRDTGTAHPSFLVYEGDANEQIHRMLKDAPIGPKTACFCLIDQRTVECKWTTVETVAQYKSEGYKIEIFYFLAQAWLDRVLVSTKDKEKLEAWWGNCNYEQFRALRSFDRARALCARFRDELGYAHVLPFSIHEKGDDSRTMYYMVHASDHPDAGRLMATAYQQARPKEDGVAPKLRW